MALAVLVVFWLNLGEPCITYIYICCQLISEGSDNEHWFVLFIKEKTNQGCLLFKLSGLNNLVFIGQKVTIGHIKVILILMEVDYQNK